MFPYQQLHHWPDGTIAAIDLPIDLYNQLRTYIALDGTVSAALPVHGSYIDFAGYKVRVTMEEVTPTTFVVRLV